MWRAVRIDTSIAVSHGLRILVETGLEAIDEVAESSLRWFPLDHNEAGDCSSAGGSEEAFRSRSRCRYYSGLGPAESQTPRPLRMSPPYAAWALEFQGNKHFVLAGCAKINLSPELETICHDCSRCFTSTRQQIFPSLPIPCARGKSSRKLHLALTILFHRIPHSPLSICLETWLRSRPALTLPVRLSPGGGLRLIGWIRFHRSSSYLMNGQLTASFCEFKVERGCRIKPGDP